MRTPQWLRLGLALMACTGGARLTAGGGGQQITLAGEPLRRAELNLQHLDTDNEYFDPATSAFPTEGWIAQWPGDTSGRLLLGLCRAYEVTGKKSPRIDALLAALPAHLNSAGYMGAVLPEGVM